MLIPCLGFLRCYFVIGVHGDSVNNVFEFCFVFKHDRYFVFHSFFTSFFSVRQRFMVLRISSMSACSISSIICSVIILYQFHFVVI